MKTDELNKMVENSLNPYIIVHIKTLQTIEEINNIHVGLDEVSIELIESAIKNSIEIEISPIESIMFLTKNDLIEFSSALNKIGIKCKISNYINELFEMDNLNELLLSLEIDEDPEFTAEFFPGFISQRQKVINIINSVFESNFGVDDVLDRINTKGSGSLNEFHKNLLK